MIFAQIMEYVYLIPLIFVWTIFILKVLYTDDAFTKRDIMEIDS